MWSCYRDEPNDILSSDSKSLKYKTSITVNTSNVRNGEEEYDANKVGKGKTKVAITAQKTIFPWFWNILES